MTLCSMDLEAISDFLLRTTLKLLIDREKIKKKVFNPFNFRCAPMVTTFIRSGGSRTQNMWKFLEKASQTDAGVRLLELEHHNHCAGSVPIYVHPSFYRSLKVRYALDVGGVSRDGCYHRTWPRVPQTGRWHPHPEDFRAIVDTE